MIPNWITDDYGRIELNKKNTCFPVKLSLEAMENPFVVDAMQDRHRRRKE